MTKRLRMNFISNLDLGQTSGGWTGTNVEVYRQLSAHFDTQFVGPINPGSDGRAKLASKLRRVSGRPGAFHFFSERRLKAISTLVGKGVDPTADCDFFHGPTPWILYDPPRPYFLYTDTCFSTYIDLYHDRTQFLEQDLKRIFAAEARWLRRASRVFFGSRWALDQVTKDYSISARNLSVAGTAGSMPISERDEYAGGMNFLFIAYDFERKGGRICAAAFKQVREQFPAARLTIVGARPPAEISAQAGVEYVGPLRKSVPAEMSKLSELYTAAFALVHPTSSDIQPLVICDAGYFGCPAITAKSFGIPELVVDGVTGLLIDPPLSAEAFAARMLALCRDSAKYLAMRKAARDFATTELTWNSVGTNIADEINAALSQPSVR